MSVYLSIAQTVNKKSNIFLSIGRPTHPDMDINENRLYLALEYKRDFSKSFSYSFFILNSRANSELDFFNSEPRLLEYINAIDLPRGIATNWSRISTFGFGGKLHFKIFKIKHHSLAISGGFGLYSSKSSRQGLDEVTFEIRFDEEGEVEETFITDVVTLEDTDTKSELFFLPALEYQFQLKRNYLIGLEANSLFDLDSEILTTHPVLANFYSFNLKLGKRF